MYCEYCGRPCTEDSFFHNENHVILKGYLTSGKKYDKVTGERLQ